MIRLMYKCRGAVSIFLIIVMVPMLVVSSIFVDTSRIKLARAVAASAGDLTLNTALTDYDSVLKDMYGLFATSQDIDKLLENLEDYYKKAIISAGVDETAAEDITGKVVSALKSATGSDDLMRMEVVDFSAQKPTGASLANPSITKAQIVEFMKYRAPLNLGASFFEALENLKTLDAQTKMLDDKNKFYQEEQSLLENLERAWSEIQKYQYAAAGDDFPTGDYITKNAQWLTTESKTFKDSYIPTLINYLTYYDSFKVVSMKVDVSTNNKGTLWNFSGHRTGEYKVYNDKKEIIVDQDVLNDLINCYQALRSLQNIKDNSSSTYSYIKNLSTKSNPSDIERIYAVARYHKDGSSGYEGAVKTLLSALATLKRDADSCDFKGDLYVETDNVRFAVTSVSVGGIPLQSAVDTLLQNFDPSNPEGTPFAEYNQIGQQLRSYYDALKGKMDIYASNVRSEAQSIRNHAKAFYDFLKPRSDNLKSAISILQGVQNELSNPSSKYNSAMGNWKASANRISDNSLGQSSLGEMEELKKVLNAEEVGKLIARLTAAKKSVDDVMTEIGKYKFGNKAWKDYSDKVDAKELFGQISSIKTQTERIVPKASNAYSTPINNAKAQVFTGNIKTTWTQAEHPNLSGQDQVKMYTWLYNNYFEPNMNYGSAAVADDTKKGEGDLSDQKGSLKGTADSLQAGGDEKKKNTTKVTNRSVKNYAEYLPSHEWEKTMNELNKAVNKNGLAKCGSEQTNGDAMLSDASSGTSTLLSGLMNALGNMAVTLRDDMYITDYAMTMFSYDTYEAEMTKKYGGDLPTFESWYEPSGDGTYALKSKYEKQAAQALNLTKNPIDPQMNYLYGSEVEYIIYGGDEPAGNIAAAYATIFMLRFALNTVYAFTDAEINNTTLAAATAIFGTPPLTPMIPIAKAAMIVGLSIAETSYDLYVLKGGDAVPLMKTNSTWMMKPSSAGKKLATKVAGEVIGVAADKAIDEGYRVLVEMIDKTDEELTEYINSNTEAIDRLCNSAVESTTQQFYNYANEALDKVLELCQSANMKEMQEFIARDESGNFIGLQATEEKVREVSSGLNAWLAQQPKNGAIYEAKKLAVDYLTANDGAEIQYIFTQVAEYGNGEIEALRKELDTIRTRIEGKISDAIDAAGTELRKIKDQTVDELKNAAQNGAESLRTKLKEQIGKSFGSSTAGQAGSTGVVASLLSWDYSDYLTLFLLIATLANEEGVLLRIEDMVQLNMQHMQGEYASIVTTETKTVSRLFGLWKSKKTVETTTKNEKAYQLSKAYTYLQIDATIEVKPLLMKIPFIADTVEKELTGKNWYTIQYSGILGY